MDEYVLAQTYLSELSFQYQAVWNIYITFYTAFLVFNMTALGLTAEKVLTGSAKRILMWAFVVQNVLSGATALGMSLFSRFIGRQSADLYRYLASQEGLTSAFSQIIVNSPIASNLGIWGGVANAISHGLFIGFWILVAHHAESENGSFASHVNDGSWFRKTYRWITRLH